MRSMRFALTASTLLLVAHCLASVPNRDVAKIAKMQEMMASAHQRASQLKIQAKALEARDLEVVAPKEHPDQTTSVDAQELKALEKYESADAPSIPDVKVSKLTSQLMTGEFVEGEKQLDEELMDTEGEEVKVDMDKEDDQPRLRRTAALNSQAQNIETQEEKAARYFAHNGLTKVGEMIKNTYQPWQASKTNAAEATQAADDETTAYQKKWTAVDRLKRESQSAGSRRRYGTFTENAGGNCSLQDEHLITSACDHLFLNSTRCYDCMACDNASCVDTIPQCDDFLAKSYTKCCIYSCEEGGGISPVTVLLFWLLVLAGIAAFMLRDSFCAERAKPSGTLLKGNETE